MTLPFTSLSAATSTAVGASRDLEGVARVHTAVLSTTGSPSGIEAYLEGSHDGAVWARLGNLQMSQPVTVDTHLVRYVRANLVGLSGGTSPSVTVTIASYVEKGA